MKKYLPIILCFMVGFLAGFCLDRKAHRKPAEPTVIVQMDTIIKVDTIVREKPVPRYVEVIRHDTLLTEYWHLQHDTVVAEVPIERKVYEEDSLYRCEISGYNAQLEYLMIYPTTTTVTVTNTILPKPAKWSFGITLGPSVLATPSGRVHAGLGATGGVSYKF